MSEMNIFTATNDRWSSAASAQPFTPGRPVVVQNLDSEDGLYVHVGQSAPSAAENTGLYLKPLEKITILSEDAGDSIVFKAQGRGPVKGLYWG